MVVTVIACNLRAQSELEKLGRRCLEEMHVLLTRTFGQPQIDVRGRPISRAHFSGHRRKNQGIRACGPVG
jgi:hypothetical protein